MSNGVKIFMVFVAVLFALIVGIAVGLGDPEPLGGAAVAFLVLFGMLCYWWGKTNGKRR